MFRPVLAFLGAAAAVVVVSALSAGAFAGKGEEPVTSVRLARTWQAALDEAKALNVPIVVHNHGFYCPPCWGMHASVMCNEDYIKFANENTVEVIQFQDLDKALAKGDAMNADERKKSAVYKAKDENGKPVEYMCEFPGLTREEVQALHTSTPNFNDTGGIPFTCIVDPHTAKEMGRFAGGGHSASKVIEGVKAQLKVLNAAHGPSVSRALLTKVTGEAKRIVDGLPKDGVAKAMAAYRKLETSVAKEGEGIKAKLVPVMEAVTAAATQQLDDAEALLGSGDLPGAKKLLDKLGRSLDGTPLESRVKELATKAKPAQ